MGFTVNYPEMLFPELFFHAFSLLGLIKKFISALFLFLGLRRFLESHIAGGGRPNFQARSTSLLPLMKFSELVVGADHDPLVDCAVCLCEFEGDDEIRRLSNCGHIFHRECLDRWMGYDRRTCPMCRTAFIPHDMQGQGILTELISG